MNLSAITPPVQDKFLDEDGNMSKRWFDWHNQVHAFLQSHSGPMGTSIPELTQVQIDAMTPRVSHPMVLNTDTNKPEILISGKYYPFELGTPR